AVTRPAPRTLRPALLLLLPLALASCEWFTDFKDQPRIEPWEAEMTGTDTIPFRGNPQLSVPISGVAVPGYVVSYQPLPATVDSMSGLANPTPVSDSSLANGRRYYQINCAVCHGATGAGNGPAVRYGMPAPSLLTPVTQNRTDGYIFGIIRNGRGLMPTYDRIEDLDRWDVVNYVRGLQGKLGGKVSTEPAGYPGQNGTAVPGYTRLAPTRPAPFELQNRETLKEQKAQADTLRRATMRPGARP
ncbi:MAG: cytochrome c, partial [Chloroflexota bacterium]|nr:cytochrome c [Chloroflexota bacterium]